MALPPSPCAPSAPAPPIFDLRNTATCVDLLNGMLSAYYRVMGGTQAVTVRYKERWVEYSKASATDLQNAYMTLYRQCPYAASAGLPDLNPQKRVRRGPPARTMQIWPRQ